MLRIKENEPSVCEKVFIKSGDNCHFVKLYIQGHVPYVSDHYQNRVNCFNKPLREKGANTELFLVRIFLDSVRIQENTDQK